MSNFRHESWKLGGTLRGHSSQHFFMGGVRIGPDLQTDVPGLFAVGEVTGGVHGANRLSGVAFADDFGLGTIAGRSAAEYAAGVTLAECSETLVQESLNEIDQPLCHHDNGMRPYQIKQKISMLFQGI